jgi:transposase
VLNGILWRLRTGAPWRDVPVRYGPWQTCYDRYVRWQQQGVWIQILQALQARAAAAGRLHWAEGSLDSTIVRAHQHAAGAPSARPPVPRDPARRQGTEALGRSRGGWTTKIHVICDAQGRPLGLHTNFDTAGELPDHTVTTPTDEP